MLLRNYRSLLARAGLLAVLWWVLTDGALGSWLFGGPVIAALAAWRLGEPAESGEPADGAGSLRPWQLVMFVPFFLRRSFTGSCDVAWRAVHWRLPISPALRPFVFRLPPYGPARVLCANCFNMLPGTLAAAWEGDTLQVHLLVDGPKPMAELRDLEERVGRLFGHQLARVQGDDEP